MVSLRFMSMVYKPEKPDHQCYTPIFDWYMVRCGSKSGYRRNFFEIVLDFPV